MSIAQCFRIIDNLPVQWCYRTEGNSDQPNYCVTGFPVGCYVTKEGLRRDNCLVFVSIYVSTAYKKLMMK